MSEDPIGLTNSINNYAYAANDPVNLSDPSGLAPCGVESIGLTIIITSTFGGCDEDDWYDGFFSSAVDQVFSLLGSVVDWGGSSITVVSPPSQQFGLPQPGEPEYVWEDVVDQSLQFELCTNRGVTNIQAATNTEGYSTYERFQAGVGFVGVLSGRFAVGKPGIGMKLLTGVSDVGAFTSGSELFAQGAGVPVLCFFNTGHKF